MIQTYGVLLFSNREKLTYFISKYFYIFPHKCQKIFSKIYLLWNGETFYWSKGVFFPKGKIHFWFHVTLIFRAMGSQLSLVCKSLVPRQVHLVMYANRFGLFWQRYFGVCGTWEFFLLSLSSEIRRLHLCYLLLNFLKSHGWIPCLSPSSRLLNGTPGDTVTLCVSVAHRVVQWVPAFYLVAASFWISLYISFLIDKMKIINLQLFSY